MKQAVPKRLPVVAGGHDCPPACCWPMPAPNYLETLKPDFSRDCRANTSRSVLRNETGGAPSLAHTIVESTMSYD